MKNKTREKKTLMEAYINIKKLLKKLHTERKQIVGCRFHHQNNIVCVCVCVL